LIAAIAYFPDRPPVPPSAAAAAKRDHDAENDADSSSETQTATGGLCAYFQCCGGNGGVEDNTLDRVEEGALEKLKSPRFVPVKKTLVLKYWIMASAMGIPLGM